MKFNFSSQKLAHIKTDVLGIFLFDGKTSVEERSRALPPSLAKEAVAFAKQSRFTGKEKTLCVLHTHRKIPAFALIFAGLGKKDATKDALAERVREASALIVSATLGNRGERIALLLPDELILPDGRQEALLGEAKTGEAIGEGIILGQYEFSKYKKQNEEEKRTVIKETIILDENDELKAGVRRSETVCGGVTLARDLVNEPAHFMHPGELALTARAIADKFPSVITINVLSKKELEGKNFGGILAVSQGSVHEPRLIHLVYKPPARHATQGEAGKKDKASGHILAIIGKGITFDSGGLSIKPAQSMETMKTDMAGAAAVLGLFSILPKLSIRREIHGIIAACENMVSGSSIHPGDIITMRNGATVEVLNTDAEGRIVLGDAFTYALEQKADTIIDLATLTGACVVALGDAIAGIVGNDEKLISALVASGREAGEKIWPLPLEESYKEAMKSDVADLRNISTLKGGGAIMGAIFLEHFVGKIPWAHLDIAGPAWVEKPLNAYIGRGATGFGVRTLARFVDTNYIISSKDESVEERKVRLLSLAGSLSPKRAGEMLKTIRTARRQG